MFPERHEKGRPGRSSRQTLNGTLWILCSGASWRDLPERFGPWKTVCHRFREWQRSGVFEQIFGAAIFKSISHGGVRQSNGTITMPDGTTLFNHLSTKTGVYTIDINKAGQIYKIRITP